MSKRAVSKPAGPIRSAPRSTPHRPVVSVALVIFVPALWLVLDGNLSVQTALVRFIGALIVGWVAAKLVFATMSSYSRSASLAVATGAADSPPSSEGAGLAGGGGPSAATSDSIDIVGIAGLGHVDVSSGRPDDNG